MTLDSLFRRSLVVSLLAALACARATATPAGAPASASELPAATPGQLARFAAQRVVVLPVQGAVGGTGDAWAGGGLADEPLRLAADRAFEAAFGERGLDGQWIFPPALQRAARRNPTYLVDPYRLRAGDAIPRALRKPDEPLGDPFASQLRALTGVSDARYALVPLTLRLEPPAAGAAARASLTMAIVDSRGAQVIWAGSATSTGVPGTDVAVQLDSLARRVADLVVLR